MDKNIAYNKNPLERGLGLLSKIPGALMLVPLFLGATINTFYPELLDIGSFSTALFRDGTGALLGLFFFCMGAQINFKQTSATLSKGTAIFLGKATAGAVVGLLVAFYTPNGVLFGVAPLAIIAAMTNSNSALFVALTKQFGNSSDRGAVSVISLNDGPFITLIILGGAGLAAFPINSLIGILLPLVIGFVVGNSSETARKFLEPGEALLIPFLGFVVGRGIDFSMLIQAGMQGVVLGIATVVISGAFAVLFLKVMFAFSSRPYEARNIISGPAEATVAGNAVATPAAVALLDPRFQEIVPIATSQIAAATIVTALIVPFLVIAVSRWQKARGISPEAEEEWVNNRKIAAEKASG